MSKRYYHYKKLAKMKSTFCICYFNRAGGTGVRRHMLKVRLIALTLLGLGLIKINDVSANFNNPRPSLILNN